MDGEVMLFCRFKTSSSFWVIRKKKEKENEDGKKLVLMK